MMFLMILFTSLPVLLLSCLMFKAAAPKQDAVQTPKQKPEAETFAATPRFFVAESTGRPSHSRLPVEVLLSQIERHVRLEQAAAETYLDGPTREALHTPTASALLN